MGNVVDHRIKRVECKRKKDEKITNYKLSYFFDMPRMEIESKVLKIDYVFTIFYKEDIGEVVVEGSLGYKDTPTALKEVEADWKNSTEVQTKIYNVIIRNAITLVMDLVRHVGLPPPILIPKIEVEKKS
jgi:hypothetical protein